MSVTHFKSILVKITGCLRFAAYLHNIQICYMWTATIIVWKGGKGYSSTLTAWSVIHIAVTHVLCSVMLIHSESKRAFLVHARVFKETQEALPFVSLDFQRPTCLPFSQLKSDEKNFTSSIKIKWRKICGINLDIKLTPKDLQLSLGISCLACKIQRRGENESYITWTDIFTIFTTVLM